MTAVIQTERLTKSYGSHRGIVELDLDVQEGEVFGFLGPNGAGKTTTMRVLLDLIRPSSGRAEVFGIETTADPVAIHRRVGYLPGEFDLYDRLTGADTIAYFGNLRGGVDAGYVAELVERLDLDTSRPFREYSKGNKQKVGLVVALQHKPDLLILDEPTAGLDPLIQQTFFALPARRGPTGARFSSRRTSSMRWTGPATGSPSSARGASSRSIGSMRSADWRSTTSSCSSGRRSRRQSSTASTASTTWSARATPCECGSMARSVRSSRQLPVADWSTS